VNERWHKSPSLETLKSCLKMVLVNVLWVTLLEPGGWTRCLPEVPSNISHSLLLYQSYSHSCTHLRVSEELPHGWKHMKVRWC